MFIFFKIYLSYYHLKKLLPALQGRNLFAARSAFLKFLSILKIMGGAHERSRARKLFDESKLSPEDLTCLYESTQEDIHYHHNISSLSDDLVLAQSHPLLPFGKLTVVDDSPSQRFLNLQTSSENKQKSPGRSGKKKAASVSHQHCMSLSAMQVNF